MKHLALAFFVCLPVCLPVWFSCSASGSEIAEPEPLTFGGDGNGKGNGTNTGGNEPSGGGNGGTGGGLLETGGAAGDPPETGDTGGGSLETGGAGGSEPETGGTGGDPLETGGTGGGPACASNYCQDNGLFSGAYCNGNNLVQCTVQDTCFVEQSSNPCSSGTSCVGNACISSCASNFCQNNNYSPGVYCDANNLVQCGVSGSCLVLLSSNPCPSGTACIGGLCTSSCSSNYCQLNGFSSGAHCNGNNLVQCGISGACIVQQNSSACPSGTSCIGSQCVADCPSCTGRCGTVSPGCTCPNTCSGTTPVCNTSTATCVQCLYNSTAAESRSCTISGTLCQNATETRSCQSNNTWGAWGTCQSPLTYRMSTNNPPCDSVLCVAASASSTGPQGVTVNTNTPYVTFAKSSGGVFDSWPSNPTWTHGYTIVTSSTQPSAASIPCESSAWSGMSTLYRQVPTSVLPTTRGQKVNIYGWVRSPCYSGSSNVYGAPGIEITRCRP